MMRRDDIQENRTFSALNSAIEVVNLVISSSTVHRCFIDDSSMFHR